MDDRIMYNNRTDDFNRFRDDIIQKLLIEDEEEIRSRLETHYKYKRKSAKFIKAECEKELVSIRASLYESSTFELLLKLLERNKDEIVDVATSKAIDKMDNYSYVITRQRSWNE